jgi:hypothetical protein
MAGGLVHMKRVKYARLGGAFGCRYENPYFRAGEDLALFLHHLGVLPKLDVIQES